MFEAQAFVDRGLLYGPALDAHDAIMRSPAGHRVLHRQHRVTGRRTVLVMTVSGAWEFSHATWKAVCACLARQGER